MPDLTADRLLDGRVQLRQPADGYRVALDPVLLAAAVTALPDDMVLDAGCGTGAAALCLLARVPGCRVAGLERAADVAAIAGLNAAANEASARLTPLVGDLADPPAELRAQSFDHVMSNPPFFPVAAGTPSPQPGREQARAESLGLPQWIDACLRRLRPGGWLTMIHRAERVDELCAALVGRAGETSLLPLWPRADAPLARRLLVRSRKGARGSARLLRGLVLHEADGRYTPAAEAVLRHGQALSWP